MLSGSMELRRRVAEGTHVLPRVEMTLANGTLLTLDSSQIMMGGLSIEDATSTGASFDIGAAVINRCSLRLLNDEGQLDAVDFAGATFVPRIGVEIDEDVEWVRRGEFGIDDNPRTLGTTVTLTGLDNMRLLEEKYSKVATSYPATLYQIVSDACEVCGVLLATPDFPNHDYVVPERPDDSALTCRAVVSYAAQVAGCFARMDAWGELRIGWYDVDAWGAEDELDGGTYDEASPYASGDSADGGGFEDELTLTPGHGHGIPYLDGDSVEGGDFDWGGVAHLHSWSSLNVATDDVVVTGIQVTAQDGGAADGTALEGETVLFGESGYVLRVEGNPLVRYGQADAVARMAGLACVGMRFRAFDGSMPGNPLLEAGDAVLVTDRRQNSYRSYVTRTTYSPGSYQAVSCAAESPGRNRADTDTAATRAVVELRKAVREEKNARQIAQEELAKRLAESSGLYMTAEKQGDDSTIYYMHDKKTLVESVVVWKLTTNAFGISTDGGKTYPYGLSATGDAILQRIYAIGLNADYVTTGHLSANYIRGGTIVGSSNSRFVIDLDGGDLYAVDSNNVGFTSVDGTISFYQFKPSGDTYTQGELYGGITAESYTLSDKSDVNLVAVEGSYGVLVGIAGETVPMSDILTGNEVSWLTFNKQNFCLVTPELATIGSSSGRASVFGGAVFTPFSVVSNMIPVRGGLYVNKSTTSIYGPSVQITSDSSSGVVTLSGKTIQLHCEQLNILSKNMAGVPKIYAGVISTASKSISFTDGGGTSHSIVVANGLVTYMS